jgi:hypothetical protein
MRDLLDANAGIALFDALETAWCRPLVAGRCERKATATAA